MPVSGNELHALLANVATARTAVAADDQEAALAELEKIKVTLWGGAVADLWQDFGRLMVQPGGPGSLRSFLADELKRRATDLGEDAIAERIERVRSEEEGETETPPIEDPPGGFEGFPGIPSGPPDDEEEPEDDGEPEAETPGTPVEPPPAGGDGEG